MDRKERRESDGRTGGQRWGGRLWGAFKPNSSKGSRGRRDVQGRINHSRGPIPT